MSKTLLLFLFIIAIAPSVSSQSDESRGEFFAGYSLLRTDVGTEDFRSPVATNDEPFKNLNGFNLAATAYLTPRFGLTADFSAHFKTENITSEVDARARSFNFLGGPQLRFTNSSRVTPFVRALAGAQRNSVNFDNAIVGGVNFGDFDTSQTDFALALGGGLDVAVSPRIAIRVFQIDYNPVFARDRDVTFGGETFRVQGERTDNVRFSIGVVFR